MGQVVANIEIFRGLQRRLLMLGETYGTDEVPELVGLIACELARDGARILVALEILDLLNGDITDFMADKTGTDALLASKLLWDRDMQDGRSNRTMLRLFRDIKACKDCGLRIDPRGFDGVGLRARDRDRMIAANLRALATNLPYDYTIILADNYHARRKAPVLGRRGSPMATYFAQTELLTVNVGFLSGAA